MSVVAGVPGRGPLVGRIKGEVGRAGAGAGIGGQGLFFGQGRPVADPGAGQKRGTGENGAAGEGLGEATTMTALLAAANRTERGQRLRALNWVKQVCVLCFIDMIERVVVIDINSSIHTAGQTALARLVLSCRACSATFDGQRPLIGIEEDSSCLRFLFYFANVTRVVTPDGISCRLQYVLCVPVRSLRVLFRSAAWRISLPKYAVAV